MHERAHHHRFPRPRFIGQHGVHAVRHVAHEPAQHLPPESLVRRVLDRDLGVHLPEPVVLRTERQHAAAAVALEREQWPHDAAFAHLAFQQYRRARFAPPERVHGRERWQRPPALRDRRVGRRHLQSGMPQARRRGHRLDVERVRRVAALRALHLHRRQIGEHGARIAALGEARATAQHEQAATAFPHEVADHPQLVAGEERGLDRAEHDGAIAEQLRARRREAVHQFERVIHPQTQVLVLGRAQECHELELLVPLDGAARELELGARFAFHVEHLLATIAHRDHGAPFVVLAHLLAQLRAHAHAQLSGAGFRHWHAQAHRRHFAVTREGHRA